MWEGAGGAQERRWLSRIDCHVESTASTGTGALTLDHAFGSYHEEERRWDTPILGPGIVGLYISDNDKLFTAQFFKSLFERLGTKWNVTTRCGRVGKT